MQARRARRQPALSGATPRRWKHGLAALALVAAGLAVAWPLLRYYHLDNRLQRWVHGWQADARWNQPRWRRHSLWLPGYTFDIEARPVEGVADNLSGLAYDSQRQRLLAVVNRPTQVLVLDRDGGVLQRHRLRGASDVEAIAWLGGEHIALLQEGRRTVVLATVPVRDGAPIDVTQARTLPLRLDRADNNGPEGLAYDRAGDALYVGKERAPAGLYALHGVLGAAVPVQVDLSGWLRSLPFATDLSSVEFDPVHRHLLLLSDESQLLAELTLDGTPVSWSTLPTRPWHLPPPQPEGVAVDEAGTIYLVSEPGLFYRMRRTAP
ncbi:MAG: SdiA-regulated domain-containing protein [Pseudomonas sp.]